MEHHEDLHLIVVSPESTLFDGISASPSHVVLVKARRVENLHYNHLESIYQLFPEFPYGYGRK